MNWRVKNLPPHDMRWKMKMSLAYLRKKGYTYDEAKKKVEWMYGLELEK